MQQQWVYGGVEFKPGDTVKVVRFEEDFARNGMGDCQPWHNQWVGGNEAEDSMDNAIGLEFEISYITDAGVIFTDFVNDGYEASRRCAAFAYPLSVLEKVQ